jgi:hypothetical protein
MRPQQIDAGRSLPDTTALVPFGNVQQQVLASPVTAETLSVAEYRPDGRVAALPRRCGTNPPEGS